MAYTPPTVADVRARFPGKFDAPAVSDGQITQALTRAARQVDESWAEDDFGEGWMLYAAAWMAAQGWGVSTQGDAAVLAGVTSMRSGALSVTFKDGGGAGGGDPALSTSYGAQFAALRRQNRGGPRLTSSTAAGWC